MPNDGANHTRPLTTKQIDALKAPAKGRLYKPDRLIPGLEIIVTTDGVKRWALRYRVRGEKQRNTAGRPVQKIHRVTLGFWPRLGLKDARSLAEEYKVAAASGVDLRAEAEETRRASDTAETTATQDEKEHLFENVLQGYFDTYVDAELRSAKDVKSKLRRLALPTFKGKDVREITKLDVTKWSASVAAKVSPKTAKNVRANLSSMLSWAEENGLVEHNVALRRASRLKGGLKGARAPLNTKRTRVLFDSETGDYSEIISVWRAAEETPWPWGHMLRLFVLTGCRHSELAALTWDEVDLGAALLRIPGERTKNGQPHTAPLSDTALQLLKECPRISPKEGEPPANPFVFTTDGVSHTCITSKWKSRIDKVSGVHGWWVHDLRRTARTIMSHVGVGRKAARALLNHSDAKGDAMDKTYDHSALSGPKKVAADALERAILTALKGGGGDTVVAIGSRRIQ